MFSTKSLSTSPRPDDLRRARAYPFSFSTDHRVNTVKNIQSYLRAHCLQLFIAVAICAGLVFGLIDQTAALAGGIMLNTTPTDLKALHEASKKAFDSMQEKNRELTSRLLEVEQKLAHRPSGGGEFGSGGGIAEMADLIMKSDQAAAFIKGSAPSVQISIPRGMFKSAIINATGSSQPLVAADRSPGIVFAPQRRFTIRDLFNAVPTNSNMVEFCRELSFTNNAGPQYDGSSPAATTEGATKPESGMSFELAQAPVSTIAHWIPASRQVLADAPALQQHLSARLLYGLKLEEEDELLNGNGTVGKLNGLVNNATAFAGGSTNLSPMDALALAIAQLAASEYEPTGFILNPADWWSDTAEEGHPGPLHPGRSGADDGTAVVGVARCRDQHHDARKVHVPGCGAYGLHRRPGRSGDPHCRTACGFLRAQSLGHALRRARRDGDRAGRRDGLRQLEQRGLIDALRLPSRRG